MPSNEKVIIGDVGTLVEIDMQDNITGATSISFEVLKPDGSEVVWTPIVINGLTFLRYTVQSGDWDQEGEFKIHPKLTLGGFTGRGNPVTIEVYRKWEDC
jgi:hypothetical protein